jgi:hypothetical protein
MRNMNHAFSGLLLMSIIVACASARSPLQKTESHTDWVAKVLRRIESIEVGKSRRELLQVFGEEGGISTRRQKRYVYRECPYIKVDVEFEPIEAKDDQRTEYPSDKIIRISKPFLEWPIHD